MLSKLNRHRLRIWQFLFVSLSTSWLLAPGLNRLLSDRLTLISQYETASQPYSWLFRLCDAVGASLLVAIAVTFYKNKHKNWVVWLLILIGLGMLLDPIFTTNCRVVGNICYEGFSWIFIGHAIETVTTAGLLLWLSAIDAARRHRAPSVTFVIFQVLYAGLLVSNYADHVKLNTLFQFTYQVSLIVWLAWFVGDYFGGQLVRRLKTKPSPLRYGAAIWMMLNGLLAIILSLKDIHLLGRADDLYFSADTAWVAQHGVIAGVAMLYLSRHLWRGEQRARQLMLAILGLEVLKYAVITPIWGWTLLYSLTFCLLFVVGDDFQRGSLPLTWKLRLKDLAYMFGALLIAGTLSFAVLHHNSRVSRITRRTASNFSFYVFHTNQIHRTRRESFLLAHTAAAFLAAGLASVLWILFKPYQLSAGETDPEEVKIVLNKYSRSSEDYFKYWPNDKEYFWDDSRQGFIAYRVAGPVVFALADPIAKDKLVEHRLVTNFTQWARQRRLKVCFLSVAESQFEIYKGFNKIQMGATAVVNSDHFLNKTVKNKWWRWKLNRATKQGYKYEVAKPPHKVKLLHELKTVSDGWLSRDKHEERGFALGYFDVNYLDDCVVHTLRDQSGKLVAFANQLPTFNNQTTATIDLMRSAAEADDAMPYLLKEVIASTHAQGYGNFDLGLVPFAETKGLIQSGVQVISETFFSSKGLTQFKNKFEPNWQNLYLMYDGDLADLTSITLNITNSLKLED